MCYCIIARSCLAFSHTTSCILPSFSHLFSVAEEAESKPKKRHHKKDREHTREREEGRGGEEGSRRSMSQKGGEQTTQQTTESGMGQTEGNDWLAGKGSVDWSRPPTQSAVDWTRQPSSPPQTQTQNDTQPQRESDKSDKARSPQRQPTNDGFDFFDVNLGQTVSSLY